MECLERIKELLDERNWTMYQLAQRAGIPQSTLSNLFVRNNSPSIATLERICNALDITMSEFFEEENDIIQEDKIIVKEWRRLSPEMKKVIIELLKGLNKK